MNAAPCSCRVRTNVILSLSASAAFSARVSSPGMPNTCRTPSFSRQRTRSCATFIVGTCLLSPMSRPMRRLLSAQRLARGLSNESLDDDRVAPRPIELRVSAIRPDLAEPDLRQQLAAGFVLGEDAGEQLPNAPALALAHQRLHRGVAGTSPARVARNVDREVGDPGAARARPILARGGPRDHGAV